MLSAELLPLEVLAPAGQAGALLLLVGALQQRQPRRLPHLFQG